MVLESRFIKVTEDNREMMYENIWKPEPIECLAEFLL